jgi:hypothetical protein
LAQVSKIAPLNTWFPELGFDLHALLPDCSPWEYAIITFMFVLGRGLIRAGENNVGEPMITFVILGVV